MNNRVVRFTLTSVRARDIQEPRFDMHHAVGYAMNRPVGLTVEIWDLSFWIDDDVTEDRSHGLMRSYPV